MKGRIEYGHLGYLRGVLQGDLDAHKVRRVVQGGQRNQAADGFDHFRVDDCGFAKLLTAVNYTVADAEQFSRVTDCGSFIQDAADEPKARLMIFDRPGPDDLMEELPELIISVFI
jgi:hypothetical protein